MNYSGVAAGLSTFLSIWLGHVLVRKIEFSASTLWVPRFLFAAAGISLEVAALISQHPILSAICGIAGITLLFDAIELTRQERRIRKGHAPANPKNPRHARILTAYPSATTWSPLKRKPAGEPTPITIQPPAKEAEE